MYPTSVSNFPGAERVVFGTKLKTSVARSDLNFDWTIKCLTCVWSQQIFCKRSREYISCRWLIKILIFWMIKRGSGPSAIVGEENIEN